MIDNTIIYPVVIHLFTAVIQFLFWGKVKIHQTVSAIGSALVLVASGFVFYKVYTGETLIMEAGNWPAPYGIIFVADMLSITLVLITSIVAFSVSIYSIVGIGRERSIFGYYPIFHILVMGLNGAFLTGDIFNLYVWFEVIIISSFVLMTLGGRKGQLEGAVKYMAMNILASTFFLTGIGILYGITGSLNMADISLKVAAIENRPMVNLTSLFFILGFGIKSAVFPLYFWLPSSYHTPPSAIAAVFGGLLTKVGVYSLFRMFTLIFIPDDNLRQILMAIAVMTIITGAFSAFTKNKIRRLFSSLIVCHIGYMIAGLGVFTQVAMVGMVFYLIHDIFIKSNLFLIAGLIKKMRGSMNMKLIGGLYNDYPRVSLLIALVLFSLIGVPPLSGFWSKIYLLEGSFDVGNYILGFAIIAGSFITLFVLARLWLEVFWKNPPEENPVKDTFVGLSRLKKSYLVVPVVLLCISTLYVGLGAQTIIEISERIVNEMLNTTPYIKAVLG